MDIVSLKDPVEVWKAAIDKPQALIDFLRSDSPISDMHREALALYFEEKLVKQKKAKGGQPRDPMQQFYNPSESDRTRFLADKYKRISHRYPRVKGRTSSALIDALSEKYKVDSEKLRNAINRNSKKFDSRLEQKNRKIKKSIGLINLFHIWLDRKSSNE